MKVTTICVAVLVATTVLIDAHATSPTVSAGDSKSRAAFDREISKLLAEQRVSSVSIARIENGKIVLTAAYGTQSAGIPATTTTLYNVASLTKPISAEVVLRLAAQDRLTLDEPMYRYWIDPDIANDERNRLLTPRLALSHQTGFPNWRYQTGKVLSFQRAPGDAFGYSGEGYEYVARFTEKKIGTGFEDLAQTLIFAPLHMTDTAYTRRSWFAGRIATPTDADGKSLEPTIADTLVASDLLYTTPADYAKFLLSVGRRDALTAAIAGERSRIQVSRKTDMCPPSKATICPEDVGIGLGWEVYRFKNDTYLMHTGNDDGVFTLVYFSPARRSGLIVFTNSANGPKIIIPMLDLIGKDKAFVDFLRSFAG